MLVVQDIHRVHGREELPFEDAYRDQIVPALAGCGAELLFFGWAPHGAGAGYEAVVLTSVPDTASLFEYQALLAGGALADVWERLETADHELHSTLLAPTGPLPAPTDSEATVPRTLYRLDTLTIDGPIDDAVAEIDAQYRATGDADLLQLVGCFTPAIGELGAPEVTVLTRITSFDGLREVLGDLAGGPWAGTPNVSGLRRRTVRVSRCAPWSPYR